MEEMPKPPSIKAKDQPVKDYLRPKSREHTFVLEKLKTLLRSSEIKMSDFHARWRVNELKMQAFIQLSDYEKMLKKLNDEGKAPSPTSITVPFTFATINTIVTYLFHTFGGRRPIFALGTYNNQQINMVTGAELLLQYNCDHARFLKHLYQFLLDNEIYGVAIMRMLWISKKRRVRVFETTDPLVAQLAMQTTGQTLPERTSRVENRVMFEGSDVSTVDPFMFFPDPRVPMTELNKNGEFCFWRAFESLHKLKLDEADGSIFSVDAANKNIPEAYGSSDSYRGMRGDREGISGTGENTSLRQYYQVDQGSVWIVPKDWGLGDSSKPELWLFTMLNKSQVVQAEPLDLFHDSLPVAVSESNSLGYAFGQLSTADYLAPMQDTMSWLVNSHIYNVRAVLNNQLVVDPSKIEMEDLKNPEPGKLIRLKNVPFGGMDIRQAVMQLPVGDVTKSHLQDFELFGKMASDLTGASDNLRGLQESGGRKTATEVRISGEAGASRLAAKAKLISSQALIDIAEQMVCNYQQFLTKEMEFRIVGDGVQQSVIVTPETLSSTEFYFPVHDGTLPMDKIGMLDIWREIFQGILTEPSGRLAATYDITKIFEFVAKLGGASNIESFKIQVQPDPMVDQQEQAGNMVPLSAVAQQLGGM